MPTHRMHVGNTRILSLIIDSTCTFNLYTVYKLITNYCNRRCTPVFAVHLTVTSFIYNIICLVCMEVDNLKTNKQILKTSVINL